MHQLDISRPSPREITFALAMGTAALLPLGVQPIIVGALVEQQQITMSELGVIVALEIVALGIGAAVSEPLVSAARFRPVVVCAALALSALDVASAFVADAVPLMGLRSAAGLSGGVLAWATTSIIVKTSAPARTAGWFFALQTIAQALLGVVLAEWIVPQFSAAGAFIALALLSLPCAVFARGLRPRWRRHELPSAPPAPLSRRDATPLLAAFLQFAAAGALWAYLEPLSLSVGLTAKGAQLLVAMMLVMQVLGAGVAAVCVHRLATLPTLLASSALLATSSIVVQFLQAGSILPFALSCALFGFVWMALPSFQIAWTLAVADSERIATLLPAAQLLGSACGPLACAPFMTESERPSSPIVSAAFAVAACVVLTLARRLHNEKAP